MPQILNNARTGYLNGVSQGWVAHSLFYANNAMYSVVLDIATVKIRVFKSTNDGTTWTEQDSANALTHTAATHSYDANMALSGTGAGYIYVAYRTATNTVRVRRFNTATDTWETTDIGAANAAGNVQAQANVRIVIRSDGDILLFFQHNSLLDNYWTRYEGTSWAAIAVVGSAGTRYPLDVIMTQNSDMAHFFYYDTAANDLYHQTISDTNVIGGTQTIDATSAVRFSSFAIYYNDAGTHRIAVKNRDSTSDSDFYYGTSAQPVTWSNVQSQAPATVTNVGLLGGSLAVFNNKYYAVWSGQDRGTIHADVSDDLTTPAWGTDTDLITGLSNNPAVFSKTIGNRGVGIVYSDQGAATPSTHFSWQYYAVHSASAIIAEVSSVSANANHIPAATTPPSISGSASTGAGQNNSGVTFSHTSGTGVNRGLLVAISVRGPFSHAQSTGVTFNGVALTFIDRAQIQFDHSIELWWLTNPPSGLTANVVTTYPANRSTVVGAINIKNVHQTVSYGTVAKTGSSTGFPTVDVSSVANDLVIDVVQRLISEDITPSAGQTELYDLFNVEVKGAASWKVATGTTTTMSWTGSTSNYRTSVGIALKPAPAGSGTGHEASGLIQSSSSVTGSAIVRKRAASTTTAVSTVSASGQLRKRGSGLIASLTSVSASGQRRQRASNQVLTVTTLSATGQVRRRTSAIIQSVSTVTAVARVKSRISGVIAGTLSVTASARKKLLSSVLISNISAVTANGRIESTATAIVSGVSSFTAFTQRRLRTSATITAVSSVSSNAQKRVFASASITEQSTVSANAQKRVFASGTITAVSSLDASASTPSSASADITLISTLLASAHLITRAQATIDSIATVSAGGQRRLRASASIASNSSASATAQARLRTSAQTQALSNLAVTAQRRLRTSVTTNAVSTVSSTAQRRLRSSSASAFLSALETNAQTRLRVNALSTWVSTVQGSATTQEGGTLHRASGEIQITSSLSAQARRFLRGQSLSQASSTLSAQAKKTTYGQATIASVASIQANSRSKRRAHADINAQVQILSVAQRRQRLQSILVLSASLNANARIIHGGSAHISALSALDITARMWYSAQASILATSSVTASSVHLEYIPTNIAYPQTSAGNEFLKGISRTPIKATQADYEANVSSRTRTPKPATQFISVRSTAR